jgi:hypothetical protein
LDEGGSAAEWIQCAAREQFRQLAETTSAPTNANLIYQTAIGSGSTIQDLAIYDSFQTLRVTSRQILRTTSVNGQK